MLFSRSDIGQILGRQPDSVNGRQRDLKNISYKVIVSIKNDSENFTRPSNLSVTARISKIFHYKRLDDSSILSPATVRALHYLVNLTRELSVMMEMGISRIRSSIMRQKRLLWSWGILLYWGEKRQSSSAMRRMNSLVEYFRRSLKLLMILISIQRSNLKRLTFSILSSKIIRSQMGTNVLVHSSSSGFLIRTNIDFEKMVSRRSMNHDSYLSHSWSPLHHQVRKIYWSDWLWTL